MLGNSIICKVKIYFVLHFGLQNDKYASNAVHVVEESTIFEFEMQNYKAEQMKNQ